MKKSVRYIWTFLTVVCSCLLFCMLASAETEGVFTYKISKDKAVITKVDPSFTGDLAIPETLGGYEVTTLDGNINCDNIAEFYIPANIIKIVDGSVDFVECEKFTVDPDSAYFSNDENGVLFSKDKSQMVRFPSRSTLSEYNVPDTVNRLISRTFQYCEALEHVSIPEGVTTLPQNAFIGAINLKSVDLPSTLTTIETNCFAWCHSLNDPEIPASVNRIDTSAFTECNSIRTFRFPEGVTTISVFALADCPSLERVYIPASVTTINNNAFMNTPLLTDIYFGGTQQQWDAITNKTAQTDGNSTFLNARLHTEYDSSVYKSIDTYMVNNIITVSGSGKLSQANGNWHYWNEYAQQAEVIIIEGNFSSVEANVFSSFPNVTTVLVNSPGLTVEKEAFNNCPLVETVIFFNDEACTADAFTGCSESLQVFLPTADKYTKTQGCAIIPYSFNENAVHFSGEVYLDSYTFFDMATAMCLIYNDIRSMKFDKITCEDITFYRYDEKNYSYVPIEGNTLENADFSVFLDSYETGRVDITFNELCNGVSDGSITNFYLVAANEKGDDVLDTEIEIKDEEKQEEDNFFIRALKWIVSLLNKLFKLLSKLG